MSVDKLK